MLWIGLISFWGLHRFLYEIIAVARSISFVKVLTPPSNSVAMVRGRCLQEHGHSARVSDRLFFSMHYYFVQMCGSKTIWQLLVFTLHTYDWYFCIYRFQQQCCCGSERCRLHFAVTHTIVLLQKPLYYNWSIYHNFSRIVQACNLWLCYSPLGSFNF